MTQSNTWNALSSDTRVRDTPLAPEVVERCLAPGVFRWFTIANLHSYCQKVTSRGKALWVPDSSGDPAAFVLYYDDAEDVFVTMVWTADGRRGQGFARALLQRLIRDSTKDIRLEVNSENPVRELYDSLGFAVLGRENESIFMVRKRRAAIMQPYLFPHLGYFHLIDASSSFVFYDDVQFSRPGWVNRNNILMAGKPHRFTVPVSSSPVDSLICDIGCAANERWVSRFLATLANAYAKAPFRGEVIDLVAGVFRDAEHRSIADVAIASVEATHRYLGRPMEVLRSSEMAAGSRGMGRVDRLTRITSELRLTSYVNAPGGAALYSKSEFAERGVDLSFVRSAFPEYEQGTRTFVPSLSIIDLLMFNEPGAVNEQARAYTLV